MNWRQAKTRAEIELRTAEAHYTRAKTEHDGTVRAERRYQLAKRELARLRAEWKRQWRRFDPSDNGSAVATPAAIVATVTDPRQSKEA